MDMELCSWVLVCITKEKCKSKVDVNDRRGSGAESRRLSSVIGGVVRWNGDGPSGVGFAFQILSKPDDGSGVRFLFNQKKSPRKAPEASGSTWLVLFWSAWQLEMSVVLLLEQKARTNRRSNIAGFSVSNGKARWGNRNWYYLCHLVK